MDMETVYLFAGVILVSSLILVVLSRSFKNKSYEEIVAEQRQQNGALYSNQAKPKTKDKKQKKALKRNKVKELQTTSNEGALDSHHDSSESGEKDDEDLGATQRASVQHVEFQELPILEKPLRETKSKQRRESVKPILVNKDSSAEFNAADINEVPLTNHFEESHPKDEFELHNAQMQMLHDKEELQSAAKIEKKKKNQQTEKKAAKLIASEPITKTAIEKVEAAPKNDADEGPKEVSNAISVEIVKEISQNGVCIAQAAKDKKKKRPDVQVNEKLPLNSTYLTTLIRKTDMSKQEVQNLIDMLLNKQHDSPEVVNEWNESKGNPLQKMKKQLAEKVQLVGELQEMLNSTQNKLREVRAEQQVERATLLQSSREWQERAEAFKHECENVALKCRQLQDAVNEEGNKSRKLLDEYQAMKMQWQQAEGSNAKLHDAEMTIENLRTDITNVVAKRNAEVVQMTQQIALAKEEIEKQDHAFRDLKTSRDNTVLHLNQDNQQLLSENQMLRDKLCSVEIHKDREVQAMQKQIDDGNKDYSKMKNEMLIAQNEARKFQGQLANVMDENMKIQEDVAKIKIINSSAMEENYKLKDELQKMQEARTNGSIESEKQHQIVINQLHAELKHLNSELEQAAVNFKFQLATASQVYEDELQRLRNINNDLRMKNWKVMEALNAAENRSKSYSANIQIQNQNVDNIKSQLMMEERDENIKFLKRLFPTAEIDPNINREQWESIIAKEVNDSVARIVASRPPIIENVFIEKEVEISNEETTKLRAKVSNYEKIISETESILFKLQTHIEEEQIRWQEQLKAKEESMELLNHELEAKNDEIRHLLQYKDQTALQLSSTSITNSSATSSVGDISETKNKQKRKKNKNSN